MDFKYKTIQCFKSNGKKGKKKERNQSQFVITEVNGCLQESDGLFHLQSVFKVAKEAICGQTDGVCCKTCETLYTTPI